MIAIEETTFINFLCLMRKNYTTNFHCHDKEYLLSVSDSSSSFFLQPGLLVSHHLIRMLDEADKAGHILEQISIVPYANPIGLSQNVLGSHLGRFSLNSGINFNRNFADLAAAVAVRVTDKLSSDSVVNVEIIRAALEEEIDLVKAVGDEANLKKILFKIACQCDIVLDLHCDSNAVMHMYTHTKLWPELSDLARYLESECHLLATTAGGMPFDDACSCHWNVLSEIFPTVPIPMACQSATVELRGESDVSTTRSCSSCI